MAANIAKGNETGFLLALGAAATAWMCAPAVLFNKPAIYRALLLLTIALLIASTIFYA